MPGRRSASAEHARREAVPVIETVVHYVKAYYDVQAARMAMANRIRAAEQGGVDIGGSTGVERLAFLEKQFLRDVNRAIKHVDIYDLFLKDVRGVGPAISGALISRVCDPARFENVSKLWAYCGMHVVEGKAPKKTKGVKQNYDHWLRSKLRVMAECMLKANSEYRKFYDDYKHRIESRPAGVAPKYKSTKNATVLPNGYTKGHAHNMALRYMVKMFLSDFLVNWREMRGLPNRKPYAEEYLGVKHHEASAD